MNLTQDHPSARELAERSRVLVHVMIEHDDVGPNYVLLLILAEQLRMLCDALEEEEVRQFRNEKLPE